MEQLKQITSAKGLVEVKNDNYLNNAHRTEVLGEKVVISTNGCATRPATEAELLHLASMANDIML